MSDWGIRITSDLRGFGDAGPRIKLLDNRTRGSLRLSWNTTKPWATSLSKEWKKVELVRELGITKYE
jgi:hypothetical protein